MKKNPSHETFFAEFALWLHTPLNKVLFARSLGINRFGVNKDKIGEVDPGFLLTAKSWVQEFLSETRQRNFQELLNMSQVAFLVESSVYLAH